MNKEKLKEEFIKEFGYHVKSGEAKTTAITGKIADWWLAKMSAQIQEIRNNVGILRQLLNEERITDPSKMITNEYILQALSLLPNPTDDK